MKSLVAGIVADGIGYGLGGADMVEEPLRKGVGKGRTGTGVVRVEDGRGAAFSDDGVKACCDDAKRLLPADTLEVTRSLRTGPAQGMKEAGFAIEPDTVVGDGALAAQGSPAHRMIGVAQDPRDPAMAPDHGDAAPVIAVAGATRPDDVAFGHGPPVTWSAFIFPLVANVTRSRPGPAAVPARRRRPASGRPGRDHVLTMTVCRVSTVGGCMEGGNLDPGFH